MSTPAVKARRVRFKSDSLGMIRKDGEHGLKFEPELVNAGGHGVVVDGIVIPGGWIAVEPDGYPDCYVPVHPSMVEAVE